MWSSMAASRAGFAQGGVGGRAGMTVGVVTATWSLESDASGEF